MRASVLVVVVAVRFVGVLLGMVVAVGCLGSCLVVLR